MRRFDSYSPCHRDTQRKLGVFVWGLKELELVYNEFMLDAETGSSPELNKDAKNREILIKVAQDFLIDGEINDVDISKMSNKELGEYAQLKFQENLKNFFEQSGLAQQISLCKDDEEALHLIANKSEGVHGWMDMLPNLIRLKPKAGMNCTMGSATLHMGLEAMNYQNVRTVAMSGHSIVLRELEDGSIKLYDANSKATVDGQLVGYTHTFSPEQISNRTEVEENSERKGFKFTLQRGEKDERGGFHIADGDGNFNRDFYAYDPSIKMDIMTAIGNLSEIKKDAETLGGVEELSLIDRNDYLRELANYIRRNNTIELSNDDIEKIGQENPQVVDEILKQAEKCFISGEAPPNPFDYLKGDLIKPRGNLEPLPPLNLFTKDAEERHQHAKELVARYPELKELDFDDIQKQFELFTSEPYTRESKFPEATGV